MKALIAYYSRTGKTAALATLISKHLDADIEPIIDSKKRKGIFGFILGGRDAVKKFLTNISKPRLDINDYDILILGTPVWAGTMTPAIRTYLAGIKPKKIALFCTFGGSGGEKTIMDMLELCVDAKLVAKLAVRTRDISNSEKAILEFTDKIKGSAK